MISPHYRGIVCAVLVVMCLSGNSAVAGNLRLVGTVSDGSVVQQDRPIALSGRAKAGAQIAVRMYQHEDQTVADEYGSWHATLPAAAPGGPYILTVRSGGETIKNRVWVGEVWLCGGQSNMSMRVIGTLESDSVVESPPSQNLHLLRVPLSLSDSPTLVTSGKWYPATVSTATRFSAVCYFFGNALAKILGVPIGLIDVSYGSTRAEPWIPNEGFESSALLSCVRTEYTKLVDGSGRQDSALAGPFRASQLYNGMVAPAGAGGARGVLWYQGEGNTVDSILYAATLEALIHGWRRALRDDLLSFVIIQLPGFGEPGDAPTDNGWSVVREAQEQVARNQRLTGIVNTIDQGDQNVHPRRKKTTAERATTEALAVAYGKNVRRSPHLVYSEFRDRRMRLVFSENLRGDGAANNGGDIFIAGANHVWHKAVVTVRNNSLWAHSPDVPAPKAARYAWARRPANPLWTMDGVPVMPFRTDNWIVSVPQTAVSRNCSKVADKSTPASERQ